MSFRDIKGQDRAISFLRDAVSKGKTAHAYIFAGPNGVGKKAVAVNFAKLLNCLSALDGEPCDACSQCRKIDAFNHPDLVLLKPRKELSEIRIEDIHSLIKDISLKPFEARKKIYIIDEAHRMNEESSNAVLKTLEEPPSDSVLILITDRITRLASTIVSRSQIIRFFPLKKSNIEDILKTKHGLDEGRSRILANIAFGSVAAALRYNKEEMLEKRDIFLNSLSEGRIVDMNLEGLPKEEAKLYLNMMLLWYRDLMVARAGLGGMSVLVNADKEKAVSKAARAMDSETIEEIMATIIATDSLLDQNINTKIAMSALEALLCTKSSR